MKSTLRNDVECANILHQIDDAIQKDDVCIRIHYYVADNRFSVLLYICVFSGRLHSHVIVSCTLDVVCSENNFYRPLCQILCRFMRYHK